MKAILKRATALLLAGVMLFAFAACTGNSGESGNGGEVSADGKVLPSDAVVDVIINSHPSWPYTENWAVWKYIKEAMGGTINVTSIPESDFGTKFTLLLATPEDLPDVIAFGGIWDNKLKAPALDGAYVSLSDNLDKMPHFSKFMDDMSEEDREVFLAPRKWLEGKVYYTPIANMERQKNVRGWLYRKDIFEKHNLKTPETLDELYEVCLKLKELYPDSYPFLMRSGMDNINTIGSQWAPYFQIEAYYNHDEGKWHYGAREDAMLDIVTFFRKMLDAKLIPAHYLSISTKEWEEMVSTNRAFIFPDYQVRIDFFNPVARQINPEFTLSACIPPKATNGTGAHLTNRTNDDPTGMIIMNTGDQKRIDNAFKYVDWFYSPEGIDIVSWGKEGETYEVVDGKKKFLLPSESDTPLTKFGFQTSGTYTVISVDAVEAIASEEQNATTEMLLEYTQRLGNPVSSMAFTSEQDTKKTDLETSIRTFVRENITKFLLGQKDISEWDAFQKELAEFDIDGLLAIYDEAYSG